MKYYKTHPWIVSCKYQEKLRDSMRDFSFSCCDPDRSCIGKNHTLVLPSSYIYMLFWDEVTLSIKTTVLLIKKMQRAFRETCTK